MTDELILSQIAEGYNLLSHFFTQAAPFLLVIILIWQLCHTIATYRWRRDIDAIPAEPLLHHGTTLGIATGDRDAMAQKMWGHELETLQLDGYGDSPRAVQLRRRLGIDDA